MSYVPERGDVIWLNLNPQAGHEQAGHRPALVLSPSSYNRTVGLAIICPITNQSKGYPFEVALPLTISVTGVVLADHVKSVDWIARKASFKCQVPDTIVEEVLGKLNAIINP